MYEIQRRHVRTPIKTSCEAQIEHRGKAHKALLVELSAAGAGLLIHQGVPFQVGFQEGDLLNLKVQTPWGPSECVAELVWFDLVTSGVRFGVRFREISPMDPLLTLADSPF